MAQFNMSDSEIAMHCARIAQLAILSAIQKNVVFKANWLDGYSQWQDEYRAYQLQWGMEEKEIRDAMDHIAGALKQLGMF